MAFLLVSTNALAQASPPTSFQPDPKSILRHGPAYRYPQAGWIVLHIEGAPYERGVQHGTLLAEEIAGYIRCFAATQSPKAPADAWKLTRTTVNALFLRRFNREYLEEMQGIADGAAQAGAKFDDRPLDLIDIAALNLWAELMTLDGALEATPTGLEGVKFPNAAPKPERGPLFGRCSAFAATAPATADGKIVFGHISMFMLYPSSFFNVWIDVKPDKGHRIVMQSFPAGIYSAMDYYINSAGLLVCETTIDQTRFDIRGETLASRMRKALQYCDSIDSLVKTLIASNNGLYTNEWLIADTKTNEIAMFELGTSRQRLYRSGENDWFGGTEGFYWGCNNTKDIAVRLDTIPGTNDRPANMVWRPSDRDMAWLRLYQKYKGKIDADFGREAFTTPPICAFPSLDAKYTTSDMAAKLRTWALFGPPLGRTWRPTKEEMRDYPEVRPMVSNPWTILSADPPIPPAEGRSAVDLVAQLSHPPETDDQKEPPKVMARTPWRGTLLPKSNGDIWLASAFAEYARIVGRELGMLNDQKKSCLCDEDRHRAASNLFGARSRYLFAAAASGDVPLSAIGPDAGRDGWYKIAFGKGVLLLNELRQRMGDDAFFYMMDDFGRKHAGRETSTPEFIAHVEMSAGKTQGELFDHWLYKTGLPTIRLAKAAVRPDGGVPSAAKGYAVDGMLSVENGPMPVMIEVIIETTDGDEFAIVPVDARTGAFTVETSHRPERLVVDKFGRTAKGNGPRVGVMAFTEEIDKTLIVRGTRDEEAANREAAEALQRGLIELWFNTAVPIRTDTEVTDEELRTHHLVLIGRPATNAVSERFASTMPIPFGPQSFAMDREFCAHPATALATAGLNPLSPRCVVTMIAGLSGASTYRCATELAQPNQDLEGAVVLFERGKKPRAVSVAAPELVRPLTSQ
jgi:hypothetical protein